MQKKGGQSNILCTNESTTTWKAESRLKEIIIVLTIMTIIMNAGINSQ